MPFRKIYSKIALEYFNIRTNISDSAYFKVLKQPQLYLSKVLKSSLVLGSLTFLVTFVYINYFNTVKIPTGVHSLIGFVIALLLVFRTNTAYDRWWEGRKRISDIQSTIAKIRIYSNSLNHKKSQEKIYFRGLCQNYLRILKEHLSDENISSKYFYHEIIHVFSFGEQKTIEEQDGYIQNCFKELIDAAVACERIKTTPIPFAYAIHVKISVFLYLITLPFSSFHELGLWSTPLVMFLYFIISAVEIISSEIENPFSGEPNDLPLKELFEEIEE